MNTTSNEFLALRKSAIEKDFSKMNAKQKEAVFQINGPLLILAGAGSGKTTVLINRVLNMITYGNAYHSTDFLGQATFGITQELSKYINGDKELSDEFKQSLGINRVKPWNILVITFTNKAADELKSRLSSKLNDDAKYVLASTFHSLCSRILRRFGEELGCTSHFTVYDSTDMKSLIKSCQKELNIDDKILSYKSILSEISNAKNNMISPKEFERNANGNFRLEQISKIYKMYQQKLKDADAMDFDDLLVNVVLLFEKSEEILNYYQEKFKYIMVDEYQDTNYVQYLLVKLLSEKSQNLCVVGDDDQSIYKFRGATIENILNFEKTFPSAKTIKLEQNYRSTQNILNAANMVIKNNKGRKNKNLWTENTVGEKIQMHTAVNEHDEAEHIINVIKSKLESGAKYSDFAVLYRTNSQSNIIERAFAKEGIPYRIVGGVRFYERKEVKDMLAYLSVINNPNDTIRMKRIINTPKRAIGEKTISRIFEAAAEHNKNVLEIMQIANNFDTLKKSANKLKSFAEMMFELIDTYNNGTSIKELYEMILEKTEYNIKLLADEKDGQSRVENVNELISNIIKYEQENGNETTLAGFLEEVSLLTNFDNFDRSSDSVVMMTMHSAKGLEFPFVFLPGFEEGIFPSARALVSEEELEEERRLAYVAITRAEKELCIISTVNRTIFGSTSKGITPSRFAVEIPEDLIEKTKTDNWKKMTPIQKAASERYKARGHSKISAMDFSHTVNSSSNEVYTVGDIICHKKFGKGIIDSVLDIGNDSLLEISFEEIGKKKLMSNFAKLTRV